MASHVVRVGDVEIMMLSDGMLEFDLCNFFPTIAEDNWTPYEAHLHEHKVRFNLGSYLIRSNGRNILVDTGLGPRPAETPRWRVATSEKRVRKSVVTARSRPSKSWWWPRPGQRP